MKKKIVPTLQQEVKIKVDIVTNDEIKIYYTGKFQDFTARYIIKIFTMFTPFLIQQACVLRTVKIKAFENIKEQGENGAKELFLLFLQHFLSFEKQLPVVSYKIDIFNLKKSKRFSPFYNGLYRFDAKPHFDALKIYIAVENIVRKGEIACNK